jgi:hypothetical protein
MHAVAARLASNRVEAPASVAYDMAPALLHLMSNEST